MRNALTCALLLASLAAAQTNHGVANAGTIPATPAVGKDSGFRFMPDDLVQYKACVTVHDANAVIPVQGVTIHIQSGTVSQSGWHDHEGIIADVLSSGPRPGPRALHAYAGDWTLDPNGNVQTLTTDAFGCATVVYQLPGIAGWYSYTVTSDPFQWGDCGPLGSPDGCYYLTAGVGTPLNFQALVPSDGSPKLVPYGYTTENPVPWYSGAYKDAGHPYAAESTVLQTPIFLSQGVAARVYSASLGYEEETSFQTDEAIVWRGSLPDGGIADNYYGDQTQSDGLPYGAYFFSDWDTLTWEYHFYGYEVDVLNPAYGNASPRLNSIPFQSKKRYFYTMVGQFANDSCTLGENQPGKNPRTSMFGSSDAAKVWWLQASSLHFVCWSSPLPRSVIY